MLGTSELVFPYYHDDNILQIAFNYSHPSPQRVLALRLSIQHHILTIQHHHRNNSWMAVAGVIPLRLLPWYFPLNPTASGA